MRGIGRWIMVMALTVVMWGCNNKDEAVKDKEAQGVSAGELEDTLTPQGDTALIKRDSALNSPDLESDRTKVADSTGRPGKVRPIFDKNLNK